MDCRLGAATSVSEAIGAAAPRQNPPLSAKKEVTFVYQKLLLFLSKPQACISSRVSVYIISSFGAVYHHGIAVHTLSCGLMIYNALH